VIHFKVGALALIVGGAFIAWIWLIESGAALIAAAVAEAIP